MPASLPAERSPARLLRCACLALISNADHVRCLLFRAPHPAWPAPGSPPGYSVADLADAAQAAMCGSALHIAGQLAKDPQLAPNPDWREDDWLDEARCRSHPAAGGQVHLIPMAFIHLSSEAGRGSWPKARERFTSLAEALLGRAALALDGEKSYRDENFWARARMAAWALDEASDLASTPHGPAQGSGEARL